MGCLLYKGLCVGCFVFLKQYLKVILYHIFLHILSLRVPKVILIVKKQSFLSLSICRQYFIPKIGMQNDMVWSIKKSHQMFELQLASSD